MNEIKYKHTQRMHNSVAASEILPYVLKINKAKSILDIGCGNGSWLKGAKELGVENVLGIDGIEVSNQDMEISSKEFLKRDLSKPLSLNKKFDLVISLEVAEHLQEESSDVFVKNLTNHGDYILFSAAIPNQGGQYHFNEQWPNYWNEKFRVNGFEAYDIIRDKFWNNEKVFWWYKQNMILYIKKDINKSLVSVEYVNSIIHPQLYNKKTTKPKYLRTNKDRIGLIFETIKSFVK